MAQCFGCERTDIKCCSTCARNPYTCNVWHRCEKDCEGYEPRIKSQGDKIRAMSDEELAEFLCGVYDEEECFGKFINGIVIPNYDEDKIAEWLKSEVEE